MRLGRCRWGGEPRAVLVEGVDGYIAASDVAFTGLLAQSSDQMKAEAVLKLPASTLDYLPPVNRPDKIICVGVNYPDHAAEAAQEIPPYPSLFVRFASSQVGHRTPIVAPSNSTKFDFEGELAVIIGRPAHRVRESDALTYVAGYACFGDNSIRDFQQHSRQITPGKNFLNSGTFGPWITTADEIADLADLTLVTRLNGSEMQRASVADLIYSVPKIIAYISSFTELLPGDVIATGTPSGVGALRTPPVWMKAGDVLEIEIDGVGHLINPVAGE